MHPTGMHYCLNIKSCSYWCFSEGRTAKKAAKRPTLGFRIVEPLYWCNEINRGFGLPTFLTVRDKGLSKLSMNLMHSHQTSNFAYQWLLSSLIKVTMTSKRSTSWRCVTLETNGLNVLFSTTISRLQKYSYYNNTPVSIIGVIIGVPGNRFNCSTFLQWEQTVLKALKFLRIFLGYFIVSFGSPLTLWSHYPLRGSHIHN